MEDAPWVMLVHPDDFDVTDITHELQLSCPEYCASTRVPGWISQLGTAPQLFIWPASEFAERYRVLGRPFQTILLTPTELTTEQRFHINAAMAVCDFDLVSYGEFANVMLKEIVEFLNRLARVGKEQIHG